MKQPADVLIQGARKLKASKTRAKLRAETEEWVARVRASWQAYQEEQARRAELREPLTEAQNRQADALLEQFGFENAKRSETQNWLDQQLEHHRRHGVGGLRATRPVSPALALPKDADPSSTWCRAKTRRGTSCRRKGTGKGGRCRLHGGKSTGPKTQEGLDRIAAAQRKRWQCWRAANPRIIPAISRRHELRLLKVFNQHQHAMMKPSEEPAKQAPQAYEARLRRHAQREAENARGRELAALHQEERQRFAKRSERHARVRRR